MHLFYIIKLLRQYYNNYVGPYLIYFGLRQQFYNGIASNNLNLVQSVSMRKLLCANIGRFGI